MAGQREHAKGPSGRETAGSLAVGLLLLPRWHVELAVPVRLLAPRGEPVRGGLGVQVALTQARTAVYNILLTLDWGF